MDRSPTIIWLVEQAVREWVLKADREVRLGSASAFCVFYMDPTRPNEIQPCGADENRCELSFEPCDVLPQRHSVDLLIDVKISQRVGGRSTVTEFQVSLDENLKVVVH
ncbi:MAG: hypothetical protein JO021_11725 [Alphaproteobacteria bacterium]|nr:hypothetical protein [Alphaproteobacteria bacterium]